MATDDHIMKSTIDTDPQRADRQRRDIRSLSLATWPITSSRVCSPFDFETDEEYEAYWRSVELRTLSGDLVKSIQELQIANFLTEHGVSFEYEPQYEHPTATPERRQYFPDFYAV